MADPVSFAISTAVQIGASYLFPSEGPRLKDLRVSASTYSNIMPRVWGRVRVAGNMIWSTPINENKQERIAGKGFTNTYTYSVDMAISWCKGPVTDLRRIWADGKLIYDITGQSTDIDNGKYTFRLYHGDEEQMPDPLIEADKGAGNTPAYRGQCYIVFENFQLEDFGNRIPQFAAEIYVGEPSDEAATVPLTLIDSGLTPGFAGSMRADFDRGYFYSTATGPGHGGLHRYRMADGVEDRQIAWDDMISPLDPNGQGPLLGVWPDGALLVACAEVNNSSTVYKLDPYSYTNVAQFGLTDDHFGTDETHISGPANAAFCTAAIDTYCLILGLFGSWTVLGSGMNYIQYGALDLGGVHALKYPAGRAAANDVDFFIFVGGDTSSGGSDTLQLVRISKSDPINPNMVVSEVVASITSDTTDLTPMRLMWDAGTDSALLFYTEGADCKLARWAVDSRSITYTVTLPAPISDGAAPSNIENNQIAFMTTGVNPSYYILDTPTGALQSRGLDFPAITGPAEALVRALVPNTTTAMPLPAGAAQADFVYDSRRQVMILFGAGTPMIVHVGQYASSAIGLDYIVETLLRAGGLAGADFDLSALQDTHVPGYGFASATDIKGVLSELKQVYLFDLVESDGIFKAVMRGSDTAVEAISGAVLGSSSDTTVDYWHETRIQEADLPAQITLGYMNIDDDFQSSTAPSRRPAAPIPVMFSHQQLQVEVLLALGADEAQTRVNTMLYTQWAERTRHETRMPWAYAYLDPTDVVTVTLEDGREYFERINSTELGADYAIHTETFGQDSGAYLQSARGDGGGSGRPQTISTPLPALPFVFNSPLLRDIDDSGGGYSRYYTAVGNAAPGTFRGATLYRSTNNLDYSVLSSETSDAEWGTVVGLIPPPSHGAWAIDWETQITIAPAVSWFELESCTDDELLAGANACMVGSEVIYFRDAVENANGTWTISYLIRAGRGTEWASNQHKPGERFVFLSATTVEPQGEVLTAKGQQRSFKAVGMGRSLIDASASTLTYYPRDLMPYAPTDVRRAIDGGSGDITLTWLRRTRFSTTIEDGTDFTPLNETSEAYEVHILSSAYAGDPSTPTLPTNVVRSYTVTSPTVVYSASDQGGDGFDVNLDTLYLVIYQISGAVGRGFPSVHAIKPSWSYL